MEIVIKNNTLFINNKEFSVINCEIPEGIYDDVTWEYRIKEPSFVGVNNCRYSITSDCFEDKFKYAEFGNLVRICENTKERIMIIKKK